MKAKLKTNNELSIAERQLILILSWANANTKGATIMMPVISPIHQALQVRKKSDLGVVSNSQSAVVPIVALIIVQNTPAMTVTPTAELMRLSLGEKLAMRNKSLAATTASRVPPNAVIT